MLLSNLAQHGGFALTCTRKKKVYLSLLPLDCVEQMVEVVEIRRITTHTGHVPPDLLDSLIERPLPAARDENVGTFLNEALGARQRQSTRSARDDCNLSFKLSHTCSF